jgi:hypothetical protein
MSLLNAIFLLISLASARSLRQELDLFRTYRGCDFCEECCIGAQRCGDEAECRVRGLVFAGTSGVFMVLVVLLLGSMAWHCVRRGKGINQL